MYISFSFSPSRAVRAQGYDRISGMETTFFNNPLSAWISAGITALVVGLALFALIWCARKRVKKSDTPHFLVQLLSQLRWYACAALAFWAGSSFLTLPANLTPILRVALIVLLALQVGTWLNQLITLRTDRELSKVPLEDLSRRSSIRGIATVLRVLVWTIILLVILESIPNLNIVSIITSLGLGGIAIGLAAQSFVSDLISSLTIRLDKPFEVGESIKTGSFFGTVERVGFKSTTLRNLSGEELTISNSALLAAPLQNFSRLQERFQSFSILFSTETSSEILDGLPSKIRQALEGIEKVRFERARLKGFSPSALDFEIAYTVTSPAFADFVQASHQVNLAVLEIIRSNGLQPGTFRLTLPEEPKST